METPHDRDYYTLRLKMRKDLHGLMLGLAQRRHIRPVWPLYEEAITLYLKVQRKMEREGLIPKPEKKQRKP